MRNRSNSLKIIQQGVSGQLQANLETYFKKLKWQNQDGGQNKKNRTDLHLKLCFWDR